MSDAQYPKLGDAKAGDAPADKAAAKAAAKLETAPAAPPVRATQSIGAAPANGPRPRKLHLSRFREAAVMRNIWQAIPEDGTPFEALLDPAYWSHHASKARIGDRIEVLAEDGSYFAELIVREQGNLSVKVAVLRKVDLEAVPETPLAEGFDVQYRGQVRKHCVVRLRDKAIVSEGHENKAAAFAWLGQNAKSLAA